MRQLPRLLRLLRRLVGLLIDVTSLRSWRLRRLDLPYPILCYAIVARLIQIDHHFLNLLQLLDLSVLLLNGPQVVVALPLDREVPAHRRIRHLVLLELQEAHWVTQIILYGLVCLAICSHFLFTYRLGSLRPANMTL